MATLLWTPLVESLWSVLMQYTGSLTWNNLRKSLEINRSYDSSKNAFPVYLSYYDTTERLNFFIALCKQHHIPLYDEESITLNSYNIVSDRNFNVDIKIFLSYLITNIEVAGPVQDKPINNMMVYQWFAENISSNNYNTSPDKFVIHKSDRDDKIFYELCSDERYAVKTDPDTNDRTNHIIMQLIKQYIFVEDVVNIEQFFMVKCDVKSEADGHQKYNFCIGVIKEQLVVWKCLYDEDFLPLLTV